MIKEINMSDSPLEEFSNGVFFVGISEEGKKDRQDFSDDEVRLFVARRDIDGHTRMERVFYREDRNMPLSELWMSGLIGGLPDNF